MVVRARRQPISLALGLLLVLPGLGLSLYALSLDTRRYLRGADAKTWPAVTGRIERSGYRDVEGRRTWYNPRRRYNPANVVANAEPLVEYSYSIDGRRYRNDRIWLIGPVQRWENPAQVAWFVNSLRPDALRVLYNPRDPGDSALILYSGAEPGFWTSLAAVPVGLGFAWIGLGLMRRPRREQDADGRIGQSGNDDGVPGR